MTLHDLFVGIEYELIQGNMEQTIAGITAHSKHVQKEYLFFCVAGARANGVDYLEEAITAGASVIVAEKFVAVPEEVTVISVLDIRKVMAQVAALFYDYPATKLHMIGITGTKGKTTTAFMLYHLLKEAGYKVGLIGTVGVTDCDGNHPTDNTTPESIVLQKILANMVTQGIEIVVMEVSSQGLKQKRVYGICFAYGVFTNLSEDHIGSNEHRSFEEYKYYKKQLMKNSRCSVINADDAYAAEMAMASNQTILYGQKALANEQNDCRQAKHIMYTACEIIPRHKNHTFGMGFTLDCNRQRQGQIYVGMPGIYSVYNALAAISVCEQMGIGSDTLYTALWSVTVKGRMEKIAVSESFHTYIDYAHNKSALEQLLMAIRIYTKQAIWLVFGCGGNRAPIRRYLMGRTASEFADFIILTNDNPRYEKPESILQDIVEGFCENTDYLIIANRKEAIRYALTHAKPGDVVVLAGKGHETYQEICGKKYEMDERMLIKEIMEEENVRTICGYNHRYFD